VVSSGASASRRPRGGSEGVVLTTGRVGRSFSPKCAARASGDIAEGNLAYPWGTAVDGSVLG
jgi:hypothetical protein